MSDDTIIDFIDTIFYSQSPFTTWNNAKVNQLHTIQIDSQLNGISRYAEYEITSFYSNGSTTKTTVAGTTILHQIYTNIQSNYLGQVQLYSLEINSNSPGLPEKSVTFDTSEQWEIGTLIVIQLEDNAPPEVEFVEPVF